MWLGDVLFGKPEQRAYRVDVDVVRDVIAVLREEYPGIEVRVQVIEPHGIIRSVWPEDLEDLSASDLQRLHVEANLPQWTSVDPFDKSMRWEISFRRDAAYFVVPTAEAPNIDESEIGRAERVAKRIRQLLQDSSMPLLRRRPVRWNAVAVLVPLALMTVAWVWAERTLSLPVPVHLLGWSALAFAAMVTVPRFQSEVHRYPLPREPKNGHLVLGQTRRQTKADRAGSRRDLKVALLSVAGTIAAAAILYFTLGIGR